jgi:hypothetical protein
MIKIRSEEVEKEDDEAFDGAEVQDVMFLLLPMRTYKKCSERAKEDGCTTAQVFERALLQYLRQNEDEPAESPRKIESSERAERPEPDIVIRRTRR